MMIKAVVLEAMHCVLVFLSFAVRGPSDFALLFVARLVLFAIEYYLGTSGETTSDNANANASDNLEDDGSFESPVDVKMDCENLPVCRNNGIRICFPVGIISGC